MIGFERGGLAPRRGGLTSTAPRGAAAGAAVNRSHHTTDEPYTTHPHAPEAQKRGVRPPRFSSASRSRDERGRGAPRFKPFDDHGAQPRLFHGARPRHPAHHDDAQRDRGDARAPSVQHKGLLPPHRDGTARAAPPSKRAPVVVGGPRRPRERAGAAPPRLEMRRRISRNAQAPSSTTTTGPFILLLRASVRSSRPLGLVRMMSPMPTRRQLGPRPSP